MDVLSDVLRAVRLTGAIYFDVHACHPWVAETPPISSYLVAFTVGPYDATPVVTTSTGWPVRVFLPRGMAAIPLNPGVIDTDMLRSCFGAEAASYPDPGEWAARAVPFILSLGAKQNGESLSVP